MQSWRPPWAGGLGEEVAGGGQLLHGLAQFNGAFLEIIAETPIPQHFKKRVVAHGVAHVVQIVVLAAGADAFLVGRGADVRAFFHARKDIFELHHARIRKHQCRVVVRHQRAGRHDRMTVLFEIVKKRPSDFTGFHHKIHLKVLNGTFGDCYNAKSIKKQLFLTL